MKYEVPPESVWRLMKANQAARIADLSKIAKSVSEVPIGVAASYAKAIEASQAARIADMSSIMSSVSAAPLGVAASFAKAIDTSQAARIADMSRIMSSVSAAPMGVTASFAKTIEASQAARVADMSRIMKSVSEASMGVATSLTKAIESSVATRMAGLSTMAVALEGLEASSIARDISTAGLDPANRSSLGLLVRLARDLSSIEEQDDAVQSQFEEREALQDSWFVWQSLLRGEILVATKRLDALAILLNDCLERIKQSPSWVRGALLTVVLNLLSSAIWQAVSDHAYRPQVSPVHIREESQLLDEFPSLEQTDAFASALDDWFMQLELAVIRKDAVPIVTSTKRKAPTLVQLFRGEVVEVVGRKKKWCRVLFRDSVGGWSVEGWVRSKYVKRF